MSAWIGIVGGIIGIVGLGLKWLWSRRERETGRLEAKLANAEREAERGQERAKIDSGVRASPDVHRELYDKWSRD